MRQPWARSAARLALAAASLSIPLAACNSGGSQVDLGAGQAVSPDAAPEAASEAKEANVIQEGSRVSIEYTLTLEDGTVVDSNTGKDPLVYTQGGGQILPALEKALSGLALTDTKNVKLSAADGYGEIDPNAYKEVELDQIPEEARKAGAMLVADDGQGHQRPIRVREVREDKIVLDFNHPLAGKDLVFDVTIVGIE